MRNLLMLMAIFTALSAVAETMTGENLEQVRAKGCQITACDSGRADLRVMDDIAPAPKASMGAVETK